MNKVGVFVDTTNLYRTVYRKFKGKLCYEAYLEQVTKDLEVGVANAYGMYIGNTDGFISCLASAGFATNFKRPRIIEIHDVKIKKCDWGVGLTMDVVAAIADLDIVIIGSSDFNLLPLIRWIKKQGVEVKIVASLIPKALKDAASSYLEIPEDWLEDEDEA